MADPKRLPLVQELERIFGIFNRGLFNGGLRLPTHVIQPDKKTVFKFVSDSYHFIIGSQLARITTEEDLYEHYLHEMVHIQNFKDHKQDCGTNKYHKTEFLEAALEAGFFVVQHKSQGWGITKLQKPKRVSAKRLRCPEPESHQRLQGVLQSLSINEQVLAQAKRDMRRPSARKCFLKFVCKCPPPHNSIRSGRRPDGTHPVNATCNDCGAKFECEET